VAIYGSGRSTAALVQPFSICLVFIPQDVLNNQVSFEEIFKINVNVLNIYHVYHLQSLYSFV
jgi:hypothetical protein